VTRVNGGLLLGVGDGRRGLSIESPLIPEKSVSFWRRGSAGTFSGSDKGNLKGLSHAMDLAFEDMHGHFKA
jgi:hypothetical protein